MNNTRQDTDVAWCAGFFDGEGHVSYRRGYVLKGGTVSCTLHASVPQNSENKETLEFFQSVVGLGKLKGPYKTKQGKTQHRLIFGVKEVMPLLIILKPYLKCEKTLDFQRAIALYHMHDSKATPDDYARTNRWKRKKGVSIYQ